ncbi:MAG: tyrosine-type recombinase/integrase [Candidatus Hermodarchaeota archaeon]
MRSNERIKQRYFEEIEQNCLVGLARRTTFAQRRKAVNYFIKFLNRSAISLKNVNSLHIQDFIQNLSQKKTYHGKPLASATLKQIIALVKSFYVRCYERNVVSEHPDLIFTKNLLRRYKLGERKLPKYIDQAKMKQLLDKCPNRWKALLHFMYDTGARISEVLEMQQQDLDFDRKLVRIYEPKTMNVRVSTISDKTIKLLQEYFSKYRPQPRPNYRSFVFINQQRRKMSPRAVQYIVKKISTEILGGQNAITPHYFRAACAVHLLESGVDIRQVQEIIGWKSLSVVQNYTRVTIQRQAELKEQYHPVFRFEKSDQLVDEEKSALRTNQKDSYQNRITEEQMKYREEVEELRKSFEQERTTHMQERQRYEKRIDAMLKLQEQLQQQVIQLLTQKSA